MVDQFLNGLRNYTNININSFEKYNLFGHLSYMKIKENTQRKNNQFFSIRYLRFS